MGEYISVKNQIIKEIDAARDKIDVDSTDRLITDLLAANQVFVVGVGRVLLSLQAFAKRLNHLGIKTFFVGEINEPAITEHDLLIVGSGSGESIFPLGIAKKSKNYGCKIVHIGSNANSSMKEIADYVVRIPVKSKLNLKDEIQSTQPMTSLFEQCLLIYGDIIAKMIIDKKNLDMDSLWEFHANLE